MRSNSTKRKIGILRYFRSSSKTKSELLEDLEDLSPGIMATDKTSRSPVRSIQRIECLSCERRTKPDKHDLYILYVVWTDRVNYQIHRKLAAFSDLHNDIKCALSQFHDLAIPEAPAPRPSGLLKEAKYKSKENLEKRRRKMEKFCQELLLLPQTEGVRTVLESYFSARPTDLEPSTMDMTDGATSTTAASHSPPKDGKDQPKLSSFIKSALSKPSRTPSSPHPSHKKTISDPNVLRDIVLSSHSAHSPLMGRNSLPGITHTDNRPNNRFQVSVKHERRKQEELDVSAGDIVVLLERHDSSGWCLVQKSQITGWIPEHILRPMARHGDAVLRQRGSLLIPASRMSCSCPDIAADQSPTLPPKQYRMRASDTGSSDPDIHSTSKQNKSGRGQHEHSPSRPRSKTSNSDTSINIYETVSIPSASSIPHIRNVLFPDAADDECGYASFGEEINSSDEENSRYATFKGGVERGGIGRVKPRYQSGNMDGSRPSSAYASVDRGRYGDYEDVRFDDDDSGYAAVNTGISERNDIYAQVIKTERGTPEISITETDTEGGGKGKYGSIVRKAPPLPQRRYSFSDVRTLLHRTDSQKQVGTTTTSDDTISGGLLAPMNPARKTKSCARIDQDTENIYESIFPESPELPRKMASTENERERSMKSPRNDAGLAPELVDELKRLKCYHGPVSTGDVSTLLHSFGNDGDFLIRPIVSKAGQLCISMRDGEHIRNFPIHFISPGRYKFAKHEFTSISSILHYYESKAICISKSEPKRPLSLGSAISPVSGDCRSSVTLTSYL